MPEKNASFTIPAPNPSAETFRFLAIAPYKSMDRIITSLAPSYPDADLVSLVGDLEEGASLVRSSISAGFDAILSRGGTAELIRPITNLPVFEIPVTVSDILAAVKLAENYSEPFVIAGFPAITTPAALLCDLLNLKTKIVTFHDRTEIDGTLTRLKEDGHTLILCDMGAYSAAARIGLVPILITSGEDSVRSAIDQAVRHCRSTSALREKCRILRESISGFPFDTIILNSDGSLYDTAADSEDIRPILPYLRSLIQKSARTPLTRVLHTIENRLYSVTLRTADSSAGKLYLFTVQADPAVPAGSCQGLKFFDSTEVREQYEHSFYRLSAAAAALDGPTGRIAQSAYPVLLTGEEGSEIGQAAARIYLNSPIAGNPYITLDCGLVNDKSWRYLTVSHNSPFCGNGSTFYISNLQLLDPARRKQLLALILDTSLHKRCRLLFSCTQSPEPGSSEALREFADTLSCILLPVPPLRSFRNDLPSMCALCLNELNQDLAGNAAGFEADALAVLSSFSWPGNLRQFRRVLTNLLLSADGPLITAETAERLLDEEERTFQNTAPSSCGLNLEQPLDLILKDISELVLERCGGNHSRAAARLEISRATLWRYLKRQRPSI